MPASRYDETHVKNLLLWLRERAKASGKSRKDESFSDAADLIEELTYDEKRLRQQLAAAKRDGGRYRFLKQYAAIEAYGNNLFPFQAISARADDEIDKLIAANKEAE